MMRTGAQLLKTGELAHKLGKFLQLLMGEFLQLPVVLAGLWLLGVALVSLFVLAFYVLLYLLGMVSGA